MFQDSASSTASQAGGPDPHQVLNPQEPVRSGVATVATLRAVADEFAPLLTHSEIALFVVHSSGIIAGASAGVERLMGIDSKSVIGSHVAAYVGSVVDPADLSAAEEMDNGVQSVSFRANIASSEGIRGDWVVQVTKRSCAADEEGVWLAVMVKDAGSASSGETLAASSSDPVTGLPSLAAAREIASRWLGMGEVVRAGLAVAAIDIEGFESINLSYGSNVGDSVLRAVGERLRVAGRREYTLCRQESDRFLMLMPVFNGVGASRSDIFAMRKSASGEYELGDVQCNIRLRLGVASAMGANTDVDDLIDLAWSAWRRAKEVGETVIYADAIKTEAVELRWFRRIVDLGLRKMNEHLMLAYQPIVRWGDECEVVGVEGLMRYRDGEGFLRSAGGLIHALEKRTALRSVDDWIISNVKARLKEIGAGPRLSVNVSCVDIFDNVNRLIEMGPGICGRLTLEITEQHLVDASKRAREALQGFREIGGRVAVDDFGSGYSSLNYLQVLPVDQLKLDRLFVARLQTEDPMEKQQAMGMLRGVKLLADSLGVSLVVEGVETREQADSVAMLGQGVMMQGFYFSKAMLADELPAAMEEITSKDAGPRS